MGQENKRMNEQKKGNMSTKEDNVQADNREMDVNPMNEKRSDALNSENRDRKNIDALDSEGRDRKNMSDHMESGKRNNIDEEKRTITNKVSNEVNPLESDHRKTADSDTNSQENDMKAERKRKEMDQDA